MIKQITNWIEDTGAWGAFWGELSCAVGVGLVHAVVVLLVQARPAAACRMAENANGLACEEYTAGV